MNEVERARDELLCGIGFTLSGLLRNVSYEVDAADAVHELATLLKDASAKQHDEDRNGVRRAMQLEDCGEAEAEGLPHPAIPTAGEAKAAAEGACPFVDASCETCCTKDCDARRAPQTPV